MNRKRFLQNFSVGAGGLLLMPSAIIAQTNPKPDPLPAEKVKEFVIVGHSDLVKVKKLLEEYLLQLETLRAKCLATKQKSQFADEERLRERISEIYISITMQEAAPGNLQLQRIETLKIELAKSEQTNNSLTTKYYSKVKEALIKEGLLKEDKPVLESKIGK